jgi:hypothetical protein
VPPSHVLEVESHSPKSARPNEGFLHRKILIALQLLGFQPSGLHRAVIIQPAWLEFPLWSGPVQLPDQGVSQVCTETTLRETEALAERIPDGAIEEPKNSREVALHRFGLGASRQSKLDAVLDFVIALEATLLEKSSDEIGFRFRVHGALLLGDTLSKRELLHDQFKELYNQRSALVHGSGKFPTDQKLADTAVLARRLCADSLRKCLVDGWPSKEDFRRLALQ